MLCVSAVLTTTSKQTERSHIVNVFSIIGEENHLGIAVKTNATLSSNSKVKRRNAAIFPWLKFHISTKFELKNRT